MILYIIWMVSSMGTDPQEYVICEEWASGRPPCIETLQHHFKFKIVICVNLLLTIASMPNGPRSSVFILEFGTAFIVDWVRNSPPTRVWPCTEAGNNDCLPVPEMRRLRLGVPLCNEGGSCFLEHRKISNLQRISKRLFPDCENMWWENCVFLPAEGKQNATFSPDFTQRGKSLLEIPCIQWWETCLVSRANKKNKESIRGDLMASKSLTFFDKRNLNWGGLKSGKKLSSVICSFTQQGHFVRSSCPQMKPKNIILSQPRVERRVFQLLRFWNLNFPPKVPTFKPPQFGNVSEIIEYLWPGSTLQCENWTT